MVNRFPWSASTLGGLLILLASEATPAGAQQVARDADAGAEPLQVVIEREPLVLRPPETYKVSLHLDPIKSVQVAAQVDGIVASISGEMGQPVQARAEVLRLDSQDRRLELERAKAALEAANIALKGAGQGGEKELAAANVEVAKLDVELAQYRLDQTIVRAPFQGLIQRVHVVEGQFVRAGEPLATIIDSTQLQVEIPVDRKAVKAGDAVEIQIEQQTASASVQGVLPLLPRFEPLRDIFESVATGIAVIGNGGGLFQPGQTVYASMIPRQPVSEIPNAAIGNNDEGTRQVQVVRDGFVRNVIVDLLAPIGEERTIVSGRFSRGDELIVRSSETLLDGTQVIPRTQLEAGTAQRSDSTTGSAPRTGSSPPPAQRQPGGF